MLQDKYERLNHLILFQIFFDQSDTFKPVVMVAHLGYVYIEWLLNEMLESDASFGCKCLMLVS